MIDRFNLRVYGICIRQESVLLVHENLDGFEFTKFPGGGLEYGEGLTDALRREIKEELDLDCTILRHLYTTDFFQQSAFKKNEQLISVYYEIEIHDLPDLSLFPLDRNQGLNHQLHFFWKPLIELNSAHLSFPIDKQMVEHDFYRSYCHPHL